MSFPTLLYIAPAALCALSWLGFGTLLLPRLRTGSALLDVLTRFGVGSGALSLVVFLLGRAGLFRPAVLVSLTAVLAVPGLWALVPTLRRLRSSQPWNRVVVALAGVTAAALALDLIAASTPPTSADALVYHVALPHYWLGIGRIDDPFWNFAAFYPMGVEMLFSQGLALQGGATASAEHGILGLLAALATYGLARELGAGRRSAGVLGAALVVLEGTFTWEATSTFVELGLTFYTLLAVWLALRYAARPRAGTAALAGLSAGAAASSKNVGLLVCAVLGVAMAPVFWKGRRLRDVGAAAAGFTALGTYWYLRDLIVVGNPVYPYLFGGRELTPFFHSYIRGSQTIYPGTHGWDPLRILILPLDLVLHGERFDRGEYVGVWIFLFAVLAAWVLRRRPLALGVAAGAFLYLVAWWYVIPQVRYLVPALAVLAALAGAALGPVLERPGRQRVALLAVLLGVVGAWAAPSLALERQLLPVAGGAETKSAFLQRLLGTHDAFEAIARRVGPKPLVAFASYRFVYWYPHRAIWLGWPEFSPDVPPAELLRRIRSEHVDYLVTLGPIPEPPAATRCFRRVESFPARYVTSRSSGTSQAIELVLYSASGCYR